MIVQLILASAIVTLGFTAPADPLCPEECGCVPRPDGLLLVNCTTINSKFRPEFVMKVTKLDLKHPDEIQLQLLKDWPRLEELDMSNSHLDSLRGLVNVDSLKTLKLSHNSIKDITADSFPKNVESLDLSFNAFAAIPQALLELKNLQKLNFYGNPIVCDCDEPSYGVQRKLVAAGVVFTKPIECLLPSDLKGKHLSSLKCKHVIEELEHMQGDDAAVWNNDVVDDEPKDEVDDVEPGYIVADSHNLDPVNEVLEHEGSGDEDHTEDPLDNNVYEGSGDEETTTEDIDLSIKPICHFNCTTDSSYEDSQETNSTTKSPPSVFELGKIFYEDITGAKPTDEPTTTSEAPVSVEEEIVYKRTKATIQGMPKEKVSDKEVEIMKVDADKTEELDRQQTTSTDQANTAYIVIAALLILIVGLVLYVMVKKKQNRSRSRQNGIDPEKPKPVEMTELIKKPIPEVHQTPEKAPLLNAQNGNANTNTNGKPKDGGDEETPLKPNNQPTMPNGDDDDVTMRPQKNENLLTPETKRVTVQAMEIPIPKTPILVNRSLSPEGKIVSTSAESP